jgi:crotonobetainyl-CoA:carnitine CoA-transferase CaiB-like acyl-CoA transferase
LQVELRDIFKTRSAQEWLQLSAEKNTPIAPVNTSANIIHDPQFKARFKILPHESHGADMLAFPVRFVGEELPEPAIAPTVGEHTEEVLREVLGYGDNKIESFREAGAFGREAS